MPDFLKWIVCFVAAGIIIAGIIALAGWVGTPPQVGIVVRKGYNAGYCTSTDTTASDGQQRHTTTCTSASYMVYIKGADSKDRPSSNFFAVPVSTWDSVKVGERFSGLCLCTEGN